jgi:hypothetical protein
MKKTIFIIILVALIGCNSAQKKSVLEPLTFNELKSFIKKDSLFEYTYKYIKHVRDSVLKSDIDKVKWADITYKRINRFLKFARDTNYFKPFKDKFKVNWNNKFGQYKKQVDSVSDYWGKYKVENSLNNYVKIELVDINKENYEYIGGVKSVNLGFRLTPLKGLIQQIRFGYKIEDKIDEYKVTSYLPSISKLDYSYCKKSEPFSVPTISYWETNYTNKDKLEYKDLQAFNRDCNITIEIEEIRKDGKNLSTDDFKIPSQVAQYWDNEKYKYLKEIYIEKIVKDILHKDYVSEMDYIIQKTDSILKKKDELCFKYIRLASDY